MQDMPTEIDRQWGKRIVMDDEVVKRVDAIWDQFWD